MNMKPATVPAAWALIGGIAAYFVASLARDSLVSAEAVADGVPRLLDASLLYLIMLLPGVVVGWLLRRNVLEWGAFAAFLGEVIRQLLYFGIERSRLPEGIAVVGPDAGYFVSMLWNSVPCAIVGAAGGAAGYVLVTRAQHISDSGK